MILYFDCLMKDAPLIPGIYTDLDKIRNSDSHYRFRPRIEVTKYMLASYAEIPWSHVIVKYELKPANARQKENFEKFVRKLWPHAKISYGVSETQKAFQEVAREISSLNDEWIFYAGNNDHPFVAPDKKLLYTCLEKAEELSKKYSYVSIIYSHYPEPLHMARQGTTLHDIGFPSSKIIEENDDFVVAEFPKGFFTSIQIVNKNLLNYWLFSKDIGDAPIWRIEEMHKFIPKNERRSQIVICPKKELFAHFDGYSHTKGTGYFVPSNLVPPLFIPEGFFQNKIKIAYGYEKAKKGYVNINPSKSNYSFESPLTGTDLKISLEKIPLFWKRRIERIDINPKANLHKLKKFADIHEESVAGIYFTKNSLNFPFYEFYVFQKRALNLIKAAKSKITQRIKSALINRA